MALKRLSKTVLSKLKFIKDPTKPREAPKKPQPEALPSSEDAPNITPVATVAKAADDDIPKTPEPPKQSLWDRAYDGLKKRDAQLVKEYEQLLSRELQTITSLKNDVLDKNDEIRVETENQIEDGNHRSRLTQMETISSNGLQQLDEKKARFNIFGHEFILRDQLAQATQFIQTIKNAIDVAVRASPEASLAWAGFCVILPIFINPSDAEEASRDGCLYVTSRVHFYVKLESLLSAGNKAQDSGLDVELEGRLITLYQLIIDFQIRTVRRVYLTRVRRLKEDTVQHEDWKSLIAKIQESEKTFSDDFKLVKDAATGAVLEELNSNAEKLFTQIVSMLASLDKTSGDVSTFNFQNAAPGDQFTATGGTQYNATNNARQFNKSAFHGQVTFN
jgi:hypothetical protein